MIVLETIAVAFSMFSALPMPQFEWNEKNMRYMFLAFPLVGALTGLLCWGGASLSEWLAFPPVLRGILLCLIPFFVTGGIHLDGYADTCDALASHADKEKRLSILSDPHIGSFAVMRLCAYFLLIFALWTGLPEFHPLPVLLMFCLSRTQSGFAVAAFPLAKNTGLASSFKEAADKKRIRGILAALDILLSILLCFNGLEGITMAAVSHIVLLYYYRMSVRQFGGITGDLAGWFLVQAEKWMLIAMVLAEYLEAVL